MSSDSEYQEPDHENISRTIIAEVKKRPALYDRTVTEYNNKHDRKRLWQDVYRSIYKDWNELSENQKKIEGDVIQKKWKNIKDSFLKELAYQRGSKPHNKKRKYIHYDSLLFLLPSLQRKRDKIWLNKPGTTQSGAATLARSSQDDNMVVDGNSSLNLTEQKVDKEEDIDEEKHFALMLVPMLRKLNDEQKHFAKIEILNVLHRARSNTVHWPVEHINIMEPQSRLSAAAVRPDDVDAREARVKEEIEMEEETEEN